MKRTAYVIKGQSFEKPTDLPEGYTVEEVVADDPRRAEVVSWGGNKLTVEVCRDDHDGVDQASLTFDVATGNVLLSLDSTRKVRDCLNAILDEAKPKRRVFLTPDNDKPWWEFEPGLFTNARTWGETRGRTSANNAWGMALTELEADYAPDTLTDVTHLHPEINEGA